MANGQGKSRKTVITGVGTVTGFGVGLGKLWDGLCSGQSCVRPIKRFDASGFPSRLAGEVEDFSAKDFVPKHYRKPVKVMARDIELAVAAAKEAVEDAGLATLGTLPEDSPEPTTYPRDRMGCHIGAGLIAAEADELTAALVKAAPGGTFDLKAWGTGGMENLTPLWMLKYLPNMVACHVTIIHGAAGPSNTITCAEASGLLSIGESMRVIERGDADLCFSGGAESKVNLMGLLRMDFAGRLAPTGQAVSGAEVVRPFDPQSTGGALGEGAGIVIIEAEETARRRNAPLYAEISGVGAAHSPRRTDENAADEGFQYAVLNAMDDAGCTPADIDAVFVQGSGVRAMDMGEAHALRAVFGRELERIPIATLGPAVGNCMAGIGGVQAAVAAKAVREQRLPARLNTGTPLAGLNAGAAPSQPATLRRVLVASSSLGGQNAAMVLSRIA
ncbi:MAG: hypothetical protein LW650_12755 [Planctomycetaceae bacterium]|jgi:3-oxoacyl-[acyl-carrier-protein] synthase II|nr:hypothetical protein [Phycisphaerales bacterium]MCE2654285.1 hypothetical protein [Planctomycetaceae bacterium]